MENVLRIKYADWRIEAVTGYKPQTTYYMDLSIAEPFGERAIRDTIRQARRDMGHNVVYMTELCMALNWKIWEHHDRGHGGAARIYDTLWREQEDWCLSHFSGEDLDYFFETID